MRFVFDEDCSNKYRGALPAFVINARFLYYLNGEEKTYGHPDDHLIEVAHKFGFTIISKDNGLIMKCIIAGIDVVKQTVDGQRILIESNKLRKLTEEDMGKLTKFESKEEHLSVLGLLPSNDSLL